MGGSGKGAVRVRMMVVDGGEDVGVGVRARAVGRLCVLVGVGVGRWVVLGEERRAGRGAGGACLNPALRARPLLWVVAVWPRLPPLDTRRQTPCPHPHCHACAPLKLPPASPSPLPQPPPLKGIADTTKRLEIVALLVGTFRSVSQ